MKNNEKKEYMEIYFQEKLILDLTEIITKTMHEKGISIEELAIMIEMDLKEVKNFMGGIGDISLRIAANMMTVMNSCFNIDAEDIQEDSYYPTIVQK